VDVPPETTEGGMTVQLWEPLMAEARLMEAIAGVLNPAKQESET